MALSWIEYLILFILFDIKNCDTIIGIRQL